MGFLEFFYGFSMVFFFRFSRVLTFFGGLVFPTKTN